MRGLVLFLMILLFLNSCKSDEDPKAIESFVVINELMAFNTTTIQDQDGEYDDWVELYNRSETTVDLSGHYLTDNKNNLTKWQFPEGTGISGRGYLIIWTDDHPDQNGLHASFRLSVDGEEILLVSPDQKILDYVIFGAQPGETSYARFPDGIGELTWDTPTFNSANIR